MIDPNQFIEEKMALFERISHRVAAGGWLLLLSTKLLVQSTDWGWTTTLLHCCWPLWPFLMAMSLAFWGMAIDGGDMAWARLYFHLVALIGFVMVQLAAILSFQLFFYVGVGLWALGAVFLWFAPSFAVPVTFYKGGAKS